MRLELVTVEVLVDGVTKCFEAAMLTKVLVDKSGGLVQPDSRGKGLL